MRKGIDLFYQINYNRKNTHRGEKGMALSLIHILPGDGLCGVSQPFLQHVLGTAAPHCGHCIGLNHQGGLFLPLYWDCSCLLYTSLLIVAVLALIGYKLLVRSPGGLAGEGQAVVYTCLLYTSHVTVCYFYCPNWFRGKGTLWVERKKNPTSKVSCIPMWGQMTSSITSRCV